MGCSFYLLDSSFPAQLIESRKFKGAFCSEEFLRCWQNQESQNSDSVQLNKNDPGKMHQKYES